ncbi:MAG: tRNA epoxyqueuosine(34) reductase QueG [Planctomycetes bacterium]|nr:tRNA epoxyqueuosine(34) reductase QueG [Planctomycetota bacterium]
MRDPIFTKASSTPDATSLLKSLAFQMGFDLAGIAPASKADGFHHLTSWLEKGFQGQMDYISKRAPAYQHPESLLNNVRSILMVGYNYKHQIDEESKSGKGRIAKYAHGKDYHEVLWEKLDLLLQEFQKTFPDCKGRGVVDTAPLLERDFARRAGLGWIGKNTMLINKKAGSFMVLGALLLDMELEPDQPFDFDHCGTCTACLRACPTEAFMGPKVLDATKCISYLTIEVKTEIPLELRGKINDWIFGCDICQDVCPWNKKSIPASDWNLWRNPDLESIDLVELLEMDKATFKARFKETPLWRRKRKGILRNACIALGNTGGQEHLKALEKARLEDEPLIKESASWAIEQIKRRLGL